MKLTRGLLAIAINFSLIFPSILIFTSHSTYAQTAGNAALQRGYRTGYSDGYMAGYRDMLDGESKVVENHQEYVAADRAFSKEYGALEDYRDGYRQGFATGYSTGYDKKTFESTVPANLDKKGISDIPTQTAAQPVQNPVAGTPDTVNVPASQTQVTANDTTQTSTYSDSTSSTAQPAAIQKAVYQDNGSVMTIPKDTDIVLELQEELGTQITKTGERFTAKVVSPMELDGAIVEGHVEKVQIPGRIKKAAELQLSFDRIVLSDTRWSNFNGVLTEVTAVKGDNVRRVSNEGTAVGHSSVKPDVIKISASTGTGAGLGAIAGGPVGLAIGASIGAAFGVGTALIDRGKHIKLNKNQQLKVRSSYDTQIR
jgi:hypothetical protein